MALIGKLHSNYKHDGGSRALIRDDCGNATGLLGTALNIRPLWKAV
jgi:hypothetical protein